MIIDTHTHLNFANFDEDRRAVIGNAKKAGVKQFIVPGVDHNSCRTAIFLAHEYPGVVFAAIGFHPYEAPKNPDLTHLESLLADQKNKGKIVAVGECGLDYHQYKGEMAAGRKDVQQRLLADQLTLAAAYNLPVILHSRDSFDDMFFLLAGAPKLRGVIHCFSGGLQDLRTALDMGLYIGIDGNVTYTKSLQQIVPHIPLSRLLLETDAPYLTPIPHRGERNEPKYLPLIAKTIAALSRKPVEYVMASATANAKQLFGI